MKIEDYKKVKDKYGSNKYKVTEDNEYYYVYEYTQGDTLGCIIIGDELNYLNNDNYLDVSNSKKSLKRLLSLIDDEVEVVIVDINQY